jgi:hypothetical protein
MTLQIPDTNHADNQARFKAIEEKLDVNTAVTEKLASDTAELVEMWKDAGVFFKWMRRAGSALVTLSKWALAIGGLYAAWKQWWGPK